jgi:hypothetical protein
LEAHHHNHPARRAASPTAEARIPRIVRTLTGEARPDRSDDDDPNDSTAPLEATDCR